MSSGNALEWFKSSYSGSEGGECLEVAYEWHKSSYSGDEGGNCVEVAHEWSKSSYSGSDGGNCIEVAQEPTAIHIRDSKAPQGHVTVGPGAWAAFLGAFGAR